MSNSRPDCSVVVNDSCVGEWSDCSEETCDESSISPEFAFSVWKTEDRGVSCSSPSDDPVAVSRNRFGGFEGAELDRDRADLFNVVKVGFGRVDAAEYSVEVDRSTFDDIVPF